MATPKTVVESTAQMMAAQHQQQTLEMMTCLPRQFRDALQMIATMMMMTGMKGDER